MDPTTFTTIRINGHEVPATRIAIERTTSRDKIRNRFGDVIGVTRGTYSAKVDLEIDGAAWQGFVDMMPEPPESSDVWLHIGGTKHLRRLFLTPEVETFAGMTEIAFSFVSGPRMADGRWSWREDAP